MKEFIAEIQSELPKLNLPVRYPYLESIASKVVMLIGASKMIEQGAYAVESFQRDSLSGVIQGGVGMFLSGIILGLSDRWHERLFRAKMTQEQEKLTNPS